MTTTDRNGEIIEVGDMVRVHERYDDWLGIIKRIYKTGTFSIQPIGSQPISYSEIPSRIIKVDKKEAEKELLD